MPMGGSLVVTLPWNWLKFYEAKAGDKVEIITYGCIAKIRLLKNNNKQLQADIEREQ